MKPADRIEITPEGRKGWRWTLYLRGKPVAQSAEQYRRKSDAKRGWHRTLNRLEDANYFQGVDGVVP